MVGVITYIVSYKTAKKKFFLDEILSEPGSTYLKDFGNNPEFGSEGVTTQKPL